MAQAYDKAGADVTVNGISPGYIATSLTQPLRDDEERNEWVSAASR